jgi:branched-chain amino acid transport system permease protein
MHYLNTIRKRFRWKNTVNYLAILAVIAVFGGVYLAGGLRASQANLLNQIAYSMILAVSLNLVVGFLGELSLGHAGFMCVGAYLGSFAALKLQPMIPSKVLLIVVAMVIGGLVAALFGFLIGLPTLRLKGDYLAITTLAFGEIVRTVFMNQAVFGGALGLESRPIRFGNGIFLVGFIVVLVMLWVLQNLLRSKHGRAITAIRDSEIAARAMGVNVTFYKLFVFVLAAFFAGVAGVIYGFSTTPISYSAFSYNYSIEILVMVVLGGMGSIRGSLVAAALLTYLDVELTTKLPGDLAVLKFLIYALILIGLVIFNNAPALRDIRERYTVKVLLEKLFGKLRRQREDASSLGTDEAAWDRVPTKVEMDAVLSMDVTPDKSFTPDKPDSNPSGKKGDR